LFRAYIEEARRFWAGRKTTARGGKGSGGRTCTSVSWSRYKEGDGYGNRKRGREAAIRDSRRRKGAPVPGKANLSIAGVEIKRRRNRYEGKRISREGKGARSFPHQESWPIFRRNVGKA